MPGNDDINLKMRIATVLFLTAMGVTAGCSDNAASAPDEASASSAEDVAKPAAKRAESGEDRGSAQFNVAGTTWIGERASARIKNDRLKISASHMTRDGDTVKRDSLDMSITGYTGPGKYKASMTSMFVRVSLDVPKDGGDEAAAEKMLTDAIGNTSNIRLANADVEITSVSDDYIDGRFSLDQPGMPDKSVTEGTFHARVRD